MRIALSFALWLALPLWSCQATPAGPPEEVADEIVFALEGGQRNKADNLFGRMPEVDRETMYPVLFTAAEERFEANDSAGSAALLDFMTEHYPSAVAVREAYLYALFIERSRTAEPSAALLAKIEETLGFLGRHDEDPPNWIHLVETQQRIDTERVPDARKAFERFLSAWDGHPSDLIVYVEDIDRFLSTH